MSNIWSDAKWEVVALENTVYYGSDFQQLPPVCFSQHAFNPVMANIFNWPPQAPTFKPVIRLALQVWHFAKIISGELACRCEDILHSTKGGDMMKATVELTETELEIAIDAIEVYVEDVRKAAVDSPQTRTWREACLEVAGSLKDRLDKHYQALSDTKSN